MILVFERYVVRQRAFVRLCTITWWAKAHYGHTSKGVHPSLQPQREPRRPQRNSDVDRELQDHLFSVQFDDTVGAKPEGVGGSDETQRLKAKREALLSQLHSSGRLSGVQ